MQKERTCNRGAILSGLAWPEVKSIIFAIVVLSTHCIKLHFVTTALIDYNTRFCSHKVFNYLYNIFPLSECFILCREVFYACL